MEIPLTHVVPGDIIHLSAGDIVPADVRMLSAKDLFVNQASLTGESLPVEKFAAPVTGATSALELNNVAFMGTNVISGTAVAMVVATGGRTYFGSIATSVAGQQVLTSFDRGIHRFIWLIIRFMLVMVPLVFLVNGITKGDWLEAFLFAVAVAVGLTPEMLPMIVTINLAKGAMAMAGKKVIVKRLNSIQNLGAMNVLCTDKTGTLTQDKVLLEKHVDVHGDESERVLEYAYLNSYYQTGLKNLLDVAVLEHVEVHEHLRPDAKFAKIDEIPFDFQRRRMSVVVAERDGPHILICKGAVEEVFNVCDRAEQHGELVQIEAEHYDELRTVTRDFNDDGFRVIAVAYKELPPGQTTYTVADEDGLVLAGYIAFLDPPKESAAEAIRVLQEYGVAVKVLTGDNEAVTRNICRQVGLPVERVVLGSEVDAMTDAELAKAAEDVSVLAKLSPAQKARVIKALHLRGHVVGFLGDGINDGPALKAADVGISVDTAVDIAKESADIILLEKSLLVLEQGVVEGRRVFGNITKYIKMGASSNFGNMFSVLGASAFLPVPADGAGADSGQQPALRLLADDGRHRHRRRGLSQAAAAVGHRQHRPLHAVHRADQLAVRLRHVRRAAVLLRRVAQRGAVPDRLVRRVAAVADADRPRHPDGQDSVRPEQAEFPAAGDDDRNLLCSDCGCRARRLPMHWD